MVEETIFDPLNFLQKFSFKLEVDDAVCGILENYDSTIIVWSCKGISIFKFIDSYKLELIKNFPLKIFTGNITILPITHNDKIMFTDGCSELRIWDKHLNLIETIKEPVFISSICGISSSSFAVGLEDATLKIYSKNEFSQIYEENEFLYHTGLVCCLLYKTKFDLLFSGSDDTTINVFSVSSRKSIRKLTDHISSISSLISLNDEEFASSCYDGMIKFWYIKQDIKIDCIKTIYTYGVNTWLNLSLIRNEFMVSSTSDSSEFKIWNLKTYECVKIYKDGSNIKNLIVTKFNPIITATKDNKLKVWNV